MRSRGATVAPVAHTAVLVGWLHCTSGRDELVAITVEQRDELALGGMICPACSKPCGPNFEPVKMNEDVRVQRWRDDRWESGFMLRS